MPRCGSDALAYSVSVAQLLNVLIYRERGKSGQDAPPTKVSPPTETFPRTWTKPVTELALHYPGQFDAAGEFVHLLRHQFLGSLASFIDSGNDKIFQHFNIIRIDNFRSNVE